MRSVPRGTVDGQHVDPGVVEQAVGYRLAVDWIADPHWHDVARIFHHRRGAANDVEVRYRESLCFCIILEVAGAPAGRPGLMAGFLVFGRP